MRQQFQGVLVELALIISLLKFSVLKFQIKG